MRQSLATGAGQLPIESVSSLGRMFVYIAIDLGTRIIWARACTVLYSRGTAHSICDPSRIIATRALNALTVPWSHYVSINCVYKQSHLLRWYKRYWNRFNHRESPIFLSIGHQRQSAISSCCEPGDQIAQWLEHTTCSRKYVAWKYTLQFISTFGRNISLSLQ